MDLARAQYFSLTAEIIPEFPFLLVHSISDCVNWSRLAITLDQLPEILGQSLNSPRSTFQPVDSDVCKRAADERIGMKIRQYPCGLMVPSTILQLLGGWNCAHLLHCLSPFG